MPAIHKNKRRAAWGASALAAVAAFALLLPAQDAQDAQDAQLTVNHSECSYFSSAGEEMTQEHLLRASKKSFKVSARTVEATTQMLASRAKASGRLTEVMTLGAIPSDLSQAGLIDRYIYEALKTAGVAPANRANDFEFARRVSFDLTGRPLPYERLMEFVNSSDSGKRARLVDSLMLTPEFADKWTMFFGDLYRNVDDNGQTRRYAEGRNAFYEYMKKSLTANKPYDKMVTEMLTNSGGNSWEQGELNWTLGGLMVGGPVQDNFDMMAEQTAKSLLGISHFNCVICHNGRGHLEPISAWGVKATRQQAWGLSAFFAKTTTQRIPADPDLRNSPYYYAVGDNARATDYALNTTTGNRSPRQPIGDTRVVTPEYPFGAGGTPKAGENYRVALARILTADVQFSRATVNYLWKEFFGRGIVEPANQFDLARLDPKNPPAAPWALQPTHPELLEALAADFSKNGFDLKRAMRQMVLSDAYQFSSAYDGTWKPEYETLFARHFVRRLWAEEVTDAIAQVSNFPGTYAYNVRSLPAIPGQSNNVNVAWSMQLPQTARLPGGNMSQFLDSFLRGNRIDAERKGEGAIPQVLNLMNDAFVMDRTRVTVRNNVPTLGRRLMDKYPDSQNSQLVDELFLTVLNRPPTETERATASSRLTGNRQQRLEDLIWSLYNKVDFVFNY